MNGATSITGAQLREARLRRRLSRHKLAVAAGLHRNSVLRLERFAQIPQTSLYALERITAQLGIDLHNGGDNLPPVSLPSQGDR